MDEYYTRLLKGHSSGLESEYIDRQELERNLFRLEILLKLQKEALGSTTFDKKDRLLYINEIEEKLRQVRGAIDEFPPYPELPPTRPLIKISGVIEQVSVRKVIGYFDFSEYTSQKIRAKNKQKRDNIGAILVMITQSLAGSVIHASVNDGERKKYKCIYAEGIVSGKKFSGWFGRTNIQLGEEIEMAVLPDGEQNRVYAVANPHQRTISMVPGCIFGLGTLSLFKTAKFTFIFFSFIFFIIAIFSPDALLGVFIAYIIASCIITGIIHHGTISDKTPQCILFEEICNALNFPDSHNLDLMLFTDEKIEELKNNGEWKPAEQQSTNMPKETSKSSGEYFFYY